MNQMGKTAGTKRVLTTVATATLRLAGAAGCLAADAPAASKTWTLATEDTELTLAVASLSLGGQCKGPAVVTGWLDKRCLGAWNVQPAVNQGHFGRTEAVPVTLTWRLPGGKEQSR